MAFYSECAGIPFVLFEKSTELGGLCRTFQHGEHRYDAGAHRFHDRDPEITRDVRHLMGDDLIEVDAPSKIHDQGRFIDFPPTPLNVIFSGLRPRDAVRAGFDVIRSRINKRPPSSFADFAIAQFGEILARRILLNYSEKLWGLPADQLSPDVATRRLQGMTLSSLFFELIWPAKKTAHIDGRFLYPKRGYGMIVEKIKATLPPASLRTGHEATALECSHGRVCRIRFADGPPAEVDGRLVSTLPLPLLASLVADSLPESARAAAAELRFRHIRLFFIRLNRARVSSSASIYVPDPELCISRIYEPKNRSQWMAPGHETSLVVEVPCFDGEPIQLETTDKLAARVIDELAELGLIERSEVIEWRHHQLRNAYPVYSLHYTKAVTVIREAMARIENLELLGRGGLFFYSHLHDQMRFGKDYVNSLATDEKQGNRC